MGWEVDVIATSSEMGMKSGIGWKECSIGIDKYTGLLDKSGRERHDAEIDE